MAASVALRRNPRLLLPRILSSPFFSTSSANLNPDPVSRTKWLIRSEPDPDHLTDLFLSAVSSASFHGDRQIYRLAVRRLAAAGRPDLIERLLELPSSNSDSSTPSSEGFLIRLLTLYSSAGMLDHAVRAFDHIAAGSRPVSDRSFCALLSAFHQNHQLDRLRDAFDKIPKERGISPGIASYNVYLKALCANDEIEIARALLDEMPSRGVKPDIVSYNEVLNGYLKKGEEVGFQEFLKEIRRKGLNPNVTTYNCRISLLCGKGRSFEAEELLDAMISNGVYPNRASFNTIIDGFCKEGDVGSAMRVFKRMQEVKRPDGTGVSPNFETYIVLTRSLVKKGEFDPALDICKECLGKKWAPPFQAVKALVDGLIKSSQVDKAKEISTKVRKAVRGDALDEWKKIEASFSW
ncbi:pentatricopeptide repeat-containing protein At2g18520, mitochondrial-like [Typha angustifolia]|uniref:pentatricopeptide repeat-containing protein At2g18520, mitochondrial-like n=1 Tax=Typha angustifolia TaxID=59011 RepID=UPI003C30B3B5